MRLSFFFIALILTSCAALGSRTKVYNKSSIQNIKRVGLITRRYDQPRNTYHNLIKESFTKTLIEELGRINTFQIVVIDTLENENLKYDEIDVNSEIDAILVADWKLSSPTSAVSDARVQLSIFDKNTKEVLLKSIHGTKLGNSYWMTPRLPKTLLDATEGAVKAMEKSLNN